MQNVLINLGLINVVVNLDLLETAFRARISTNVQSDLMHATITQFVSILREVLAANVKRDIAEMEKHALMMTNVK